MFALTVHAKISKPIDHNVVNPIKKLSKIIFVSYNVSVQWGKFKLQ